MSVGQLGSLSCKVVFLILSFVLMERVFAAGKKRRKKQAGKMWQEQQRSSQTNPGTHQEFLFQCGLQTIELENPSLLKNNKK